MFTGLVQALGTVVAAVPEGPGRRLVVRCKTTAQHAAVGASIAVNGCCLTVVEVEQDRLTFEAGPETLSRTNLGQLASGSRVNLEASLRAGDPLGGHFVTGHIDAIGTLQDRKDQGEWSMLTFAVPANLTEQMVSKGSIAVDGVSLTLVDVADATFSVQLIPHTLSVTTLGGLAAGDPVNIETDLLAKYAAKAVGR
ncbi:MAG: riboflavin synthase [Planctomycetales bacterium]|nr:riboflavin synthase [Planctomycetales bacterium]NIM09293.1 riboflavin synthase [Planctomycetales bacterium]NIN08761.1 riboflavin synthase [Planctomycetales bacterium]NIN77880.1 riboflavin synthase [Planctomycetales bacterium]NIO35063.1 riboflavin synthase [Planctomycetales bacterium]